MDNAGDHMKLEGRHWPCLQIDLGVVTPADPQESMRPPAAQNFNQNYYNGMDLENSVNWAEYSNEDEQVAGSVSTNPNCSYFDERGFSGYSESGDFFNINNDRRLDAASHTAVVDTTEDQSDDFLEDLELEEEEDDTIEQQQCISSRYEEPEEWYQDPYGDDFTNDMNFMEDFWRPDRPLLRWAMAEDWNQSLEDCWISSLLNRKVKKSTNFCGIKPTSEMSNLELDDHDTLLLIIESIKSRGQANEGVRMLHEYLGGKPVMNLEPYLQEFDFYLKRYVVWGLNYYNNLDQINKYGRGYQKTPTNTVPPQTSEDYVCNMKMKKLSIRMLQGSQDVEDVLEKYWDYLLSWFIDAYDLALKRLDEHAN